MKTSETILKEGMRELIDEAFNLGREESRPKWIDVNERLPLTGQYILVCSSRGFISMTYFSSAYKGKSIEVFRDVTHWMELPKPPEK